jgi:ABC-type Na+ efflux pump permease subunit
LCISISTAFSREALTGISGGGLPWLLYVPPFTPFVLLLREPAGVSSFSLLAALGSLLIATAAVTWLAIGRLTLSHAAAGYKSPA